MKTDYQDMPFWESMAKAQSFRLPQHQTTLTAGRMERLLRATGKSIDWYRDWSGFRSLKQFVEANPEWSARAFAGLLLETNSPQEDAIEEVQAGQSFGSTRSPVSRRRRSVRVQGSGRGSAFRVGTSFAAR